MKIKYLVLSLVISLGFTTIVSAQTKVAVRFARGSHSASVKGSITGYKYVAYVLGAQAGQNMTVHVTSTNDKAQLVILDPDNENVEYGDGVGDYRGTLEKTGNYTVRVLMSRADARRKGAATSYIVTFTIQ
jgi:hypothetical protein